MQILRILSRLLPSFLHTCPRPPCPPEPFFLVIGHRGSPRKRVENTIPSCERALRDGANGLEIDLCMTRDGEVVLWHDWDPEGLVARLRQRNWEPTVKYRPAVPPPGDPFRRRVSQLTLDELRGHYGYARGKQILRRREKAHIPTFAEFLDWAVAQASLDFVILDIKVPPDELALAPRVAEAIARAIEARGPRFQSVLFTPEKTVLKAMKEAQPQLEYCFDMELPTGLVFQPEACACVQAAIELGNQVASIGRPTMFTYAPWRTYTEVLVCDLQRRQAHNATGSGKRIEALIGWTINNTREMRCLLKLGLTGILTDRPARLRRMARWKGRVMAWRGRPAAGAPAPPPA